MNQRQAVLEYLKTHKKGITPMEALNKFGIMRLSSVIYDLKYKYDCKIVTNIIEVKDRNGKTKHVAQYVLVGD